LSPFKDFPFLFAIKMASESDVYGQPDLEPNFAQTDGMLPLISAALENPSTPTHDELIVRAFAASRASLRWVLWRLSLLVQMIEETDWLHATAKIGALATLRANFSRDIAVVADKLRTDGDPLSLEFRSALQKALLLIRRNLYEDGQIIDQGMAGRCDPDLWGGGIPFAAATPSDPEPRISLCASWFSMNADLHRDVITHEFFHLIGLIDQRIIANSWDALNDADTMTQIVAYIHDRRRWEDSSGLSKPTAFYPAP